MDTSTSKNSAVQAVINAGELITAHSAGPKVDADLSNLGIFKNGAVVYQDGIIIDVGTTDSMISKHQPASNQVPHLPLLKTGPVPAKLPRPIHKG